MRVIKFCIFRTFMFLDGNHSELSITFYLILTFTRNNLYFSRLKRFFKKFLTLRNVNVLTGLITLDLTSNFFNRPIPLLLTCRRFFMTKFLTSLIKENFKSSNCWKRRSGLNFSHHVYILLKIKFQNKVSRLRRTGFFLITILQFCFLKIILKADVQKNKIHKNENYFVYS